MFEKSLAVILIVGFISSTPAAAAERRPSITRGVEYLYHMMNPAGNWETVPAPEPFKPNENGALVTNTNFTGRTALAVYALLSCGEKAVDPRLAKAIELLKTSPAPRGTYALAFRCLALASLPQSADVRKALIRDSRALLANANPRGQATYSRQSKERPDASNSQVMALGLSAASECGIEIPDRFFSAAENAWHADQLPDGAWSYAPSHKENQAHLNAHPGMTAAGVATLFLIADAKANASSPRDKADPHLERGLAWLSKNFNVFFDFNFFGDRSLYCLYALERVGVAGGVKRFDKEPWFERGTRYLESKQNAEGAWTIGVDGSADGTVCSAFALLFLCHADAPAAVNKLRYAATEDDAASPSWNPRQRDVSRWTAWLSRTTEQKLRWQVVDLATSADLDDAPVLYVSGTKPPALSDADIAALKAYAERGGLIVFAPESNAKPFTDAARALGTKMFPDIEWRRLPDTHPLLTQQQFKAAVWKQKSAVQGLSNGTREMALIVDDDVSRLLQAGASQTSTQAFELGADIVQYTANPVLPITPMPAAPAAAPSARVDVARVVMKNEEARAWPLLVARLAAEGSTAVNLTTIKAGEPVPSGTRLLHLPVNGPGGVQESDLKPLHDFTEAGGTVLIEAAGGSAAAAVAADGLVAQGWPDSAETDLPDAVAQAVQLRRGVLLAGERGKPLSVRKAGAGRVVVSRVDLSAGWAGLHHDSIPGLTPESATAVMKLLLRP